MNTPQMASVKWMLFKNSTRATIPSHGVFQGVGDAFVEPDSGEIMISAGPCDIGPYFINGPSAVPDGGYGMCGVPSNCVMFLRFEGDAPSLTPWFSKVGPGPGEYVAKTTGEEAVVYAGYHSDDGTIISVMSLATGGDGFPLIHFEIVTADCYTSTATATVDNVPCDCTSISIGDSIDLVDLYGHFDGESTLVGRGGWAIRMKESGGYGCGWVIQSLDPESFRC